MLFRSGGASSKYDGAPAQWELAESALRNACRRTGLQAKVEPGEAAFYGPKIDVKLVDAIGRTWQLSTIQLDFNLPRRFGLEYIAEDGKAHQPLMVHRALFGSVERFFGILIEHYAGASTGSRPYAIIVISHTAMFKYFRKHARTQINPVLWICGLILYATIPVLITLRFLRRSISLILK